MSEDLRERRSHVNLKGKEHGRGKSQCKGPEVGDCLGIEGTAEASETGAESRRERRSLMRPEENRSRTLRDLPASHALE